MSAVSAARVDLNLRRLVKPDALIVGAGLMGRWHARTARKLGAHVVGIVDSDLRAARDLARAMPDAAPVDSVAAALAATTPTVAHICTPTAAHVTAALALIEAGVHVLIEKPFSSSAAQAAELTDAARKAGVVVCPVHQYAFQRGVAHAERWLRVLGAPRRVHFDIRSAGADTLPLSRKDDIVAEILPHPISMVQRLMPNVSLAGLVWQITRSQAGEFVAQAAADGATICISISLTARPTCFRTHILTPGGAIDIDGFHGFATLSRGGGASRATKILGPIVESIDTLSAAGVNLARRAIDREPAYPGLAFLTAAFYRAAAGMAPAPISFDTIVAGMQTWEQLRGACAP